MSRLLAALAAGLAILLSGCATPPAAPGTAVADGPPNLWSGRFAATVTEAGPDGREERSSGSFSLRVDGARTQLELYSLMGQTLAQVSLDDGQATLVASDGKAWQAASAEALTEEVFGWRVPLGSLPDWLEGRIAEPTEHDGARIVAGLERGWAIRIDAHDAGRPRRLALDWPAGARVGERRLSLRLVVDSALRIVARP